jgi:signal transduction histidine kinase
MLQDINLLKEKEASLQEAVEKLDLQIKLREDFVLGLSHDLSTPLTTAKLSVQMIARTATDPNSLSKFTTRCMQSIERMEQMIKDLLDANRIHAGEKIQMNATRFDLARLTTNTVENLSPTYKGRLRVIAPEKCMGNWGKNQIRRVIENLVNNAAKYGSGNSPITICANKVDEDRVSLTVHNFGNPISEKDQESLFEQFKRTESAEKSSKQGWGVGLTLVRGIVESHLGKISVKSTADEGTTFTIVMPTDGLDLKKEG